MTVEAILKFNRRYVPTVRPDVRIIDLLIMLEADDVGAIVVSTDGMHVDGIISERDVVRGLNRHGLSAIYQPVSDWMQRKVHSCGPKSAVRDVMTLMRTHRIRHVPVIDGGRLVGLISIHDVMALRLEEMESEADDMKNYIGLGCLSKKSPTAPTGTGSALH